MNTPECRYMNDAMYRATVDMMEGLIHEAQFTPSEIREMAVLAAIHYELNRVRPYTVIPSEVNNAFHILDKWCTEEIPPQETMKPLGDKKNKL